MKILKIIGLILLIIILVVVGISFTLPSTAHIERNVVINAPRDVVWLELDGYRTFNAFSTWAERDPETKYTYAGPSFGVGARMAWSSEQQDVGSGWMEIIEAIDYEQVTSRLGFDGYDGQPTATWSLEDADVNTRVTYSYHEEGLGFVEKFFFAFIKSSLIQDYDETLANLKDRIENRPDFPMPISREEAEAINYLGYRTSSPPDDATLQARISEGYGRLADVMRSNELTQSGDPLAVFHSHDANQVVFTLGIPVPAGTVYEGEEMEIFETPTGWVVRASHYGAQENLAETHAKLDQFREFYGLQQAGDPWEVYLTPTETNPLQITHVYYPIN